MIKTLPQAGFFYKFIAAMRHSKFRFIFIFFICLLCILYWIFLRPITDFKEPEKSFYIKSNETDKNKVIRELKEKDILSSSIGFQILSSLFDYDQSVKPGKYLFKKSSNTLSIFWILFKGRQTPVKLVINKYRTREALASMVSTHLECDSLSIIEFMNNTDSVSTLNLDTNNIMTLIIPNTYSFFWDISSSEFWRRMKKENDKFWNQERQEESEKLGLKKEEVYILASIVEEETNKNDEKSIISSVYLNRLKKGMPLSADPTIKFALRDFGIKRITIPHILSSEQSPYNTYKNKGLPPGPICTPSIKTIDAVLNTSKTDFLFFCAKPDFSGYHSFASTATEHFKNARAYQKALDDLKIK